MKNKPPINAETAETRDFFFFKTISESLYTQNQDSGACKRYKTNLSPHEVVDNLNKEQLSYCNCICIAPEHGFYIEGRTSNQLGMSKQFRFYTVEKSKKRLLSSDEIQLIDSSKIYIEKIFVDNEGRKHLEESKNHIPILSKTPVVKAMTLEFDLEDSEPATTRRQHQGSPIDVIRTRRGTTEELLTERERVLSVIKSSKTTRN